MSISNTWKFKKDYTTIKRANGRKKEKRELACKGNQVIRAYQSVRNKNKKEGLTLFAYVNADVTDIFYRVYRVFKKNLHFSNGVYFC